MKGLTKKMIMDHPEVVKTLKGRIKVDSVNNVLFSQKENEYAKEEIYKQICNALEKEGAIEIEVVDQGAETVVEGSITFIDHKLVKKLSDQEGGAQ